MSLPVHLAADLAGVRIGETVVVTGPEAHHAVAVRRLSVGEQVVLTDGLGVRVVGTVEAVEKGRFDLVAESVRAVERPTPRITVVQALPKGDRGELAVEMLTEVGVDTIVPWAASRCVAVWKGDRALKAAAKWRSTAREAAKQSRRSWFPEVDDLAQTADLMALVSAADLAVVLHKEASEPLAASAVPVVGTIVVVVGPEGGLTDAEVEILRAAGARPVRLGAEVLRTSTAGVAAVAAILTRTPRWT